MWRFYSLGKFARKNQRGKDDLKNSSERASFQNLVGRAKYP